MKRPAGSSSTKDIQWYVSLQAAQELQNGLAPAIAGLYEEGEVNHINCEKCYS